MPHSLVFRVAICALPLALTGCPRDKNEETLTAAEAKQALEESTLQSQAQALTSEAIELSTNFTIGQAAENAVAELREFISTQLPCAEITLDGATLTVDYGATGAGCLYHGRTITGQSQISVTTNEAAEVVVQHAWSDLSNGVVEVDGQATVTWSFDDPSRHVVHTATITRLRDNWQLESEGDRTQRPLDGGLIEGFSVEGTRAWSSPRGNSTLVIEDVEMRWIDPVPQAGSYLLTTPNHKQLSLSFNRKDDDTITVTLAGPKKEFAFDVSKSGAATSADE
jgi:hypothetical protein